MGSTILLIDDSAILRRIATNVLGCSPARYEVSATNRITEGFARACVARPDLILLDAELARDARQEFCTRLLKESRTATVPVVLLLGKGVPMPVLEDRPDNVVDVLVKPFTPEQLLDAVTSILGAIKRGTTMAEARAQRLPRGAEKPQTVLVDRQAVTAAVRRSPASILDRSRETPALPAANSIWRTQPRTEAAVAPEATAALETTDTKAVSLRALFKTVAAHHFNGAMSLGARGQTFVDVYFDAGKLVAVTTFNAEAYGEDALAHLPPKVSPATLEAALAEQTKNGVPFMLTLGVKGLLSKAAAISLLHEFGQRFFARVWERRGQPLKVGFSSLDALPSFALRLEPRRESADEWLLGSSRRLTPADVAATARHEGFVGTPLMTKGGQDTLAALRLTDEERAVASRVNGRNDLPGIARDTGATPEATYLVLYRLRALDAVEYRPAPAAFVVTPRTNLRRVLPLRR